jgi:BMFP domain-containing protein YqiC
MLESRPLEDLSRQLGRLLPPGLGALRRELEDNFRAVLRAHLDRFELVSRERFDTQAALLARTQQQLQALERRLATLEQRAPE